MTITELIVALEAIADQYGHDLEVAVALQESYPLAGTVGALTVLDADDDEAAPPTLWLAVGAPDGNPYAPREAWHTPVYEWL